MIAGEVTEEGAVLIKISVARRTWRTLVDTGFNGDLELPEKLRRHVNPRLRGPVRFLLAGGVEIEEPVFMVDFPFDGEMCLADATFVDGEEILLGTGLLMQHCLEVNFPARTVKLERVDN